MEKGKSVKVGNYSIELSSFEDGVDKVVVSSMSGNWSVCWGINLSAAQFLVYLVDMLDKEEDAKQIIEEVLTVLFSTTNILDAEFIMREMEVINEYVEKKREVPEDDEQFVKDSKTVVEMAEKVNETEEKPKRRRGSRKKAE